MWPENAPKTCWAISKTSILVLVPKKTFHCVCICLVYNLGQSKHFKTRIPSWTKTITYSGITPRYLRISSTSKKVCPSNSYQTPNGPKQLVSYYPNPLKNHTLEIRTNKFKTENWENEKGFLFGSLLSQLKCKSINPLTIMFENMWMVRKYELALSKHTTI